MFPAIPRGSRNQNLNLLAVQVHIGFANRLGRPEIGRMPIQAGTMLIVRLDQKHDGIENVAQIDLLAAFRLWRSGLIKVCAHGPAPSR